MGVALGMWGAALHRAFEFADAAEESVVELLLLDEPRRLLYECCLDLGEFFREACDE